MFQFSISDISDDSWLDNMMILRLIRRFSLQKYIWNRGDHFSISPLFWNQSPLEKAFACWILSNHWSLVGLDLLIRLYMGEAGCKKKTQHTTHNKTFPQRDLGRTGVQWTFFGFLFEGTRPKVGYLPMHKIKNGGHPFAVYSTYKAQPNQLIEHFKWRISPKGISTKNCLIQDSYDW